MTMKLCLGHGLCWGHEMGKSHIDEWKEKELEGMVRKALFRTRSSSSLGPDETGYRDQGRYGGGRDWPEWRREATRGNPGAAVHRHSLDRLNAINDSLNK